MTQYDLGKVVADDGVGIESIEKTSTSGLVDTYTITYTNGDTDTFDVTNGSDGSDGTDGANIWTTSTAPSTPDYTFNISDLVAQTGKTVNTGDIILYSYYRYTVASVDSSTVLCGNRVSIRGAKGDTGATGATGKGISSISKTSTSGLVDTYTITYSDSSTPTTYTVTNGQDGIDGTDGQDGSNGRGISSISKTSTSGLVDTYTITYDDSSTPTTYNVTNGADGASTADRVTDSNSANYTSLGTLSANASQQTINNAINSMIGSLLNVDLVIVVSNLPTASEDTMNKIYLVANSSSSQTNTYDEHITVRTGTAPNYSYTWEDVGSVSMDLSDYIQKSQTAGLLKNDGTVDTTTKLTASDIVDNLTTNDATKVLSAKQGKALADLIGDAIIYINGTGS